MANLDLKTSTYETGPTLPKDCPKRHRIDIDDDNLLTDYQVQVLTSLIDKHINDILAEISLGKSTANEAKEIVKELKALIIIQSMLE